MKEERKYEDVCCSLGIWAADSEEHNQAAETFKKYKAQVEADMKPCSKTLEEFRRYLTDTLGMQQAELTNGELRSYNAQWVRKYCPQRLTTPELILPKERVPTSDEMTAWMNNDAKRFKESMSISPKETGYVFTKYVKEYYVDDYKLSDVEVVLESTTEDFIAGGKSQPRNTAEEKLVRTLIDDIALYKGVAAEDIANGTERYEAYVATLAARMRDEAKENKSLENK